MIEKMQTKLRERLLEILSTLNENEIKTLINRYGVADFHVQTRNDLGELKYHNSLKDALAYAKVNMDVWKVSFQNKAGERIRLVRKDRGGADETWLFEPIEHDGELLL